jgi:periplasmic protein TonB
LDALPPVTYPLLASLNPDNVNSSLRFLSLDEDVAPPPAPPPPRSQQSSGQLMDASVIRSPKPVYPPAAKAMGATGKVEVQVVISESGRVVNATAISGPMILRPAAAAAASQWVFNPATRDGIPVRTEKVLSFTFGDK